MAVITFTDEASSQIPPARAFEGLIIDGDNLIPKIMPQAFKSIEVLEGDRGAGTIKKINFTEGTPLSYLKHRIDEINAETFKYCYTMIEGDALTGKLEKITYEIQLMASPAGGTIAKTTRKYYPLDGVETSEEEIKTGQERSRAMFKVLEDYLIKNPEAYA